MYLCSNELYLAFILIYCLSRIVAFVPMIAVRQYSRTCAQLNRVKFHSNALVRAAKLLSGDAEGIHKAAAELRNGRLVAFPTETVYGLGAHAFNADAVQQIFITKQRPNTDPLIVHISDTDMIHDLYDFRESDNAANVCKVLAKAFWPGPLTIIFKAQPQVPSVITAGTGFVGVRCPKHPTALALIHEAGIPIAAPSANRFGHVSPTSALHVMDDLGHSDISIIADDTALTGGCSIGVESTVCRISKDGRQVSILRCGAVTVNMLRKALTTSNMRDCEVIVDNERHLKAKGTESHTAEVHCKETRVGESSTKNTITAPAQSTNDSDEAAIAPGQMLKHYAPDIPTFIVHNAHQYMTTHSILQDGDKNSLNKVNDNSISYALQNAMIIDFGGQLSLLKPSVRHYLDLSPQGSAAEACVTLFDVLRRSESEEVKQMGVTHVLLPNLSHHSHLSATNSNSNSNYSSSGTDSSFHSIHGGSDDLQSALWERMHRAASGIFV